MIAQISETIDSEGYHIVTAITEKGNVAVEKYFYESDKERAYENAQQRALDKDWWFKTELVVLGYYIVSGTTTFFTQLNRRWDGIKQVKSYVSL